MVAADGVAMWRAGASPVISLELPVRLARVPAAPAAQAAEPAMGSSAGSPRPASPTKVTKGGARGLTGLPFPTSLMHSLRCMHGWAHCSSTPLLSAKALQTREVCW